jgi:tRNA G26 N,N-dimethylase Trm1
MGYPAEDAPPRPRYPMDFTLFEDRYPEMDEKMVENAMEVMDKGYLEQDYYKKARAKISMENGKQDEYTYKNYSWTEHISRKWGQWLTTPDELLDQLEKCGFNVRYGEEAHR